MASLLFLGMDTPFFVHEGNAFGTRMCLKKGETPILPDTVRDSADCTLHVARNVKDNEVYTLSTPLNRGAT